MNIHKKLKVGKKVILLKTIGHLQRLTTFTIIMVENEMVILKPIVEDDILTKCPIHLFHRLFIEKEDRYDYVRVFFKFLLAEHVFLNTHIELSIRVNFHTVNNWEKLLLSENPLHWMLLIPAAGMTHNIFAFEKWLRLSQEWTSLYKELRTNAEIDNHDIELDI